MIVFLDRLRHGAQVTCLVYINGMNIQRVYMLLKKCLGVHIDSKLNWNEHTFYVSSKLKSLKKMYR